MLTQAAGGQLSETSWLPNRPEPVLYQNGFAFADGKARLELTGENRIFLTWKEPDYAARMFRCGVND
ncbi:hypothetical protein [Syntrophomonas palmitatica]|uniref:hypothetical protein n=1 Tax=Syntrophomonas palmitatica TaxID=402877 RepID=UPI000A4D7393|nr:hypothetical protein [Syntrophomonas palmitatica]